MPPRRTSPPTAARDCSSSDSEIPHSAAYSLTRDVHPPKVALATRREAEVATTFILSRWHLVSVQNLRRACIQHSVDRHRAELPRLSEQTYHDRRSVHAPNTSTPATIDTAAASNEIGMVMAHARYPATEIPAAIEKPMTPANPIHHRQPSTTQTQSPVHRAKHVVKVYGQSLARACFRALRRFSRAVLCRYLLTKSPTTIKMPNSKYNESPRPTDRRHRREETSEFVPEREGMTAVPRGLRTCRTNDGAEKSESSEEFCGVPRGGP